MPFESPDIKLCDLLTSIDKGDIQLPDFQREWKWDSDRIASLLASVSQGHPVGVVMTLETGGEGVDFAPTPLAGTEVNGATPHELLLDGQQRLTSLYQAMYAGRSVDTKDAREKRIRRWYYVDMRLALVEGADPDDAVIAVPEDRVVRDNFGRDVVADYSTTENECTHEMFPLRIAFDPEAVRRWAQVYLRLDGDSGIPARLSRWDRFYDSVLKRITDYTVPVIRLTRATPKEAVCTVFEKVNTGGVPLNVFELLTATFASAGFRLKDDWEQRGNRIHSRPVTRTFESTDFLQVVALLATRQRRQDFLAAGGAVEEAPGLSCKRRDILRLSLTDYQRWADAVTDALGWCFEFLGQERFFTASDLPYRTQLVPLAAIRVILGDRADRIGTHALLRRWFWCGVLGEMYGGTTETRFARDVEQVPAWVEGGNEPSTVADADFRSARLLTLKSRNSAAYKGVYALLMRSECLDWMYKRHLDQADFFAYKVDIHHIFPKAWCHKNGIDPLRRESIVNKTALSSDTNRAIGGRSPADYLPIVAARAGVTPETLDAILATHHLDSAALRAADFDGFFELRRRALLDLISDAMGKRPSEDMTDDVMTSQYEVEEDETSDDDLITEVLDQEDAEADVVYVTSAGDRFHMLADCVGILGGQASAGAQAFATEPVATMELEEAVRLGRSSCGFCGGEAATLTRNGPDWTPYRITTPDGTTPPLRKRQAVLAMVSALHAAGVPAERLASALPGQRLLSVAGTVTGAALKEAFVQAHPGAANRLGRWFFDTPLTEDGRTWVLSKGWGLNTEPTLARLTALAPSGTEFAYRRGPR